MEQSGASTAYVEGLCKSDYSTTQMANVVRNLMQSPPSLAGLRKKGFVEIIAEYKMRFWEGNEDLKKNMFRMIIILILLLLTSCNTSKDTTTLKDGTYVLEHTGEEAVLFPSVTITGNDISFTYDVLSSYKPYGSYTIDNNVLTMKTSDGKYKYFLK